MNIKNHHANVEGSDRLLGGESGLLSEYMKAEIGTSLGTYLENPECRVAFVFHSSAFPELHKRMESPTLSTPLPSPLILSMAVSPCVETNADAHSPICLRAEVSGPEDIEALRRLFAHPCLYVGHQTTPDMCCLLALGISIPLRMWDIRHAQRLSTLGCLNSNARAKSVEEQAAHIEAKVAWKDISLNKLDFYAIASHYRVQCYSRGVMENILLVAENQRLAMAKTALLECAEKIDMPWLGVLAQMHYQGACIDTSRHEKLLQKADRTLRKVLAELESLGICNPNSHKELEDYFTRSGDIHRLRAGSGHCSFSSDALEPLAEGNPAIGLLRRFRRASGICFLQRDVEQRLAASRKSRIHPQHIALGTETGRQVCNQPNLLGFCQIQRNLVIPSPGYSIAEVDYAQQEILILAGLSGDETLTDMYNTGDVYLEMARRFYAGTDVIEPDAQEWSAQVFSQTYPELREAMKVVMLATLYGQKAPSIARKLEVSERQAEQFLEYFSELFPRVSWYMGERASDSLRRGWVELVNGVTIALDKHPYIKPGARRRMARNYPIQGTGAVVFRHTGVQLAQALAPMEGRILAPMHDSFVIEAPEESFEKACDVTAETMKRVMRHYFPALVPRVDINAGFPEYWNKDKNPHALAEYLQTH